MQPGSDPEVFKFQLLWYTGLLVFKLLIHVNTCLFVNLFSFFFVFVRRPSMQSGSMSKRGHVRGERLRDHAKIHVPVSPRIHRYTCNFMLGALTHYRREGKWWGWRLGLSVDSSRSKDAAKYPPWVRTCQLIRQVTWICVWRTTPRSR